VMCAPPQVIVGLTRDPVRRIGEAWA